MLKAPESLYLPHGERAVLLLHAYSGSPNDVRMLSRFLEKQDYTVYAPLFTGHGTLDPLDILQKDPAVWWEDTKAALAFLQQKGYQEIAVFGLSMGGIYATRLMTESNQTLVGGGFFCSPITPVKTNVVENFLVYAEQVLTRAKVTDPLNDKLALYQPLVQKQLAAIEQQAQVANQNLMTIKQPFFMAQAGQDEMIDARGVFTTAQKLTQTDFTLKWYQNSGHVITVGPARRQLEEDVAAFLKTLEWKGSVK